MQCHGLIDGFLLRFLGAAAEQDNQRLSIFGEVDAIARPPIDLVLTDSSEPIHVRCITKLEPRLGHSYLGSSLCIQSVKPCLVRTGAVFPDVFFELDLHDLW